MGEQRIERVQQMHAHCPGCFFIALAFEQVKQAWVAEQESLHRALAETATAIRTAKSGNAAQECCSAQLGTSLHTVQRSGNCWASQRAMAALTDTGFSCAIQCPDRTVTSVKFLQSRRMGSARRDSTVSQT